MHSKSVIKLIVAFNRNSMTNSSKIGQRRRHKCTLEPNMLNVEVKFSNIQHIFESNFGGKFCNNIIIYILMDSSCKTNVCVIFL